MGIHNSNAVRKVAAKKFVAQRAQNIIACIAVMLTTFMVYTVFSLGSSFGKSMEIQQMQGHGTSADMLLQSPTQEQLAELDRLGLCKHIGVCTAVATLTGMEGTGIRQGYFRYADEVCWEEQLRPALMDVEGRYPEAENEVMLPRWAAKKLGFADPKLGQEIKLPFYYGYIFMRYGRLSDDMEKTFVICGLYDDAGSMMVEGKAAMYVSKSFWDGAPGEMGQYRRAAYLTLNDRAGAAKLPEMLELADENQEFADLTPQTAQGMEGVIQIGAAVFLVILCGGLIIYNILYISVAQDIQFLGKLKTLGMTRRQLKKYIGFGVRWLCMIGIPAGLALAALVSVFIVPLALHSATSRLAGMDVHVSFSPVLFAGAALVSAATVFLGSRKPLRVAGKVSPVLAAVYVGVSSRKEQKKQRDSMLSIAWRNVFRRRKSAVAVLLSLFLAAVVFLTVDGVLSVVTPSAMVSESMAYDLIVRNEYQQGDLITDTDITQVAGMHGVRQVEIKRIPVGVTPWIKAGSAVEKYSNLYLEKIAAAMPKEQIDEQKRAFIKDGNYASNIIGIGEQEFGRISEKYGLDISYGEFRSGKAGIWCYSDFLEGDDAESDLLAAETGPLSVCFSGLGGEELAGGFTVEKMAGQPVEMIGLISFFAPNILVSNEMLQEVGESVVWEMNILTDGPSEDALVHDALQGMFQDAEGVNIESKQEKAERLDGSFATIRTLSAFLSFILFAIGIMNFINTVYAGILSRDRELAMLECIGMSKKQVKKMLVGEGMIYVAITCILTATLGNAIYLGAFHVFANMTGWSKFHYPLRAAGITAAAMLLTAVAVPLLSYRSVSKEHAVEQLRRTG